MKHPEIVAVMSGVVKGAVYTGVEVWLYNMHFAFAVFAMPFELCSMAVTNPAQRAIRGIHQSVNGQHEVIFAAFGER